MSIHIIKSTKTRNKGLPKILRSLWDDSSLSLKAKGLITYCLTRDEEEELDVPKVSKALGIGRDYYRSAINECIDQGYAYRFQLRLENGLIGGFSTFISGSKEDIEHEKQAHEECEPIPEEYEDNTTACNEG